MSDNRPSKKQRELLSFIDGFIKGNGYGPSYREIMRALEYKSVSTVAVHIEGLIARGLLRKKTHSARSLEVVASKSIDAGVEPHLIWLRCELKKREKENKPQSRDEVKIIKEVLDILSED